MIAPNTDEVGKKLPTVIGDDHNLIDAARRQAMERALEASKTGNIAGQADAIRLFLQLFG